MGIVRQGGHRARSLQGSKGRFNQRTLPIKIKGLAVLCLIAGNLMGDDVAPAPAYPPYVLPNTVCRVLP
jgi:hypothetical protein